MKLSPHTRAVHHSTTRCGGEHHRGRFKHSSHFILVAIASTQGRLRFTLHDAYWYLSKIYEQFKSLCVSSVVV